MPLNIAHSRRDDEPSERQARLRASLSNLAGTQVAIQSGVDVLAHVPDDTEGITPELFRHHGPPEHGA